MSHDLTALEAMGLAIRSEEEAAKFYGEVAKRIKNGLVRAKYESLVREEIGHRELLVNLYRKMTGEKGAPPRIPGSPKTAEGGFPVATESFDEILRFAMSREQEAQSFYIRLAESTKDQTGRRTFQYLADIERGHEMILKVELEAYLRDKGWYADNPDVQLVGP